MILVPRNLVLKRILVKDRPVLALDTGFEADSMEGIRLVKASRGTGWFFHEGRLSPWTTKGVLQEDRRLVVWGDLDRVPEGENPAAWPQDGAEGREFLRAFVLAWTARAEAEPLKAFGPSAVLPWRTATGWAFVFPPDDLRGVLDSIQPLSDRLSWDHYRHPDAVGAASWAFTSAALGVFLLSRTLPWVQADEAHLRQELRVLKRTLTEDELPEEPDAATLRLWLEALKGQDGTPVPRWKAWALEDRPWDSPRSEANNLRRTKARQKRERRRGQAAFWRRKGTVITVAAVATAVVLAVVGSVVWGLVKPDPTDGWTPEQVVTGYYTGISTLDSEVLRKLASFDSGKEPDLAHDQEEATNLYVIRQVRTAYEQKSPVLDAAEWEAAGKPTVEPGRMLYGLAGLEYQHDGTAWVVRYRKWTGEAGEDKLMHPLGTSVVDRLVLTKTGRGWKISSLRRERQPLP